MSPSQPKVWSLNPAVVTLLITIACILTGGGYYVGHQAAVIEQIQKQSDTAVAAATTAQTIAASDRPVAEPDPTPTPKGAKK